MGADSGTKHGEPGNSAGGGEWGLRGLHVRFQRLAEGSAEYSRRVEQSGGPAAATLRCESGKWRAAICFFEFRCGDLGMGDGADQRSAVGSGESGQTA